MPTKVMKEGRITIPKWVRDHLGIESGTEVAFRLAADGSVIIERVDGTRPPSRFAELVGIAGRADAWRGPVGQVGCHREQSEAIHSFYAASWIASLRSQ